MPLLPGGAPRAEGRHEDGPSPARVPPLPDREIHARAEPAAVAAEAAARQGRFWEMHDRLFDHQHRLADDDLLEHARVLGLDLNRFRSDLADGDLGRRVRKVRAAGERSGVTGTPTFFVDGRRFEEPWRQLFRRLVNG